ncbi:MAG: LamG domain-containing protein [Phycisphaerae bacterium]|nr:LamG domain-containing protein [Phycisphaerae bacterium]
MCRKSNYLISFALLLSLVLSGGVQADLVGWWRLDDGSGATAIDSSGSGNDGTFQGSPQWVAGKVGGGLAFDGGDYVNVPGATDIKPESLTLMTWVSFDSVAGGRQDFVSKDDDYAFSLHEGAADQKIHGIVTSAGDWSVVHGSTVVETDTWYHTALTYDSSTQMLVLYLDGQVDGELSVPAGVEHRRGGPLTLGTFSGRDLLGKLDDIKIFDHAMSELEIKGEMTGKGFPNAYGPSPADGALHEATWVTLSWRQGDFAVSHDVYLGENFDDVDNGTENTFRGNQGDLLYIAGFAGFAYPDGLVPGTTYYWRIDEVNEADPNSPWKGNIWSFSIPPKTAHNPDPSDGAEFVDPDATFSWTPGFGAKLHTVYMGANFDDVNNAAGGTPLGSASYSPAALESEKVYYWRVDEFDPPFTHKGDVWGFTTPGAVGNPQPANAAVDVQMIATLSWTPADNAASHELYFGTDVGAVRNATPSSPEYIGPRALGAESYDPGGLAWHASYCWRVDEVYADKTVKGLVWSFTTADFLLVDDFESYNDIDPPDPASNRIFESWLDGFGTTTNGALVGNELPPYAEQSIVHGGAQSIPYFYDNNLKTSEATLTLVYPRDWTEEGVTKLSLWFRGASGNAAERMFVALGNAVVYHDDASATQMTGWNQWVVDLTAFAGVDLTNVNTITVGVGTKGSPAAGGAGTMYFDDIRLVR